jgi:hypothetical protein
VFVELRAATAHALQATDALARELDTLRRALHDTIPEIRDVYFSFHDSLTSVRAPDTQPTG